MNRRTLLQAITGAVAFGAMARPIAANFASVGTPVIITPEGFAPGGVLLTWFDPKTNAHSPAHRPHFHNGRYTLRAAAIFRHEFEIPGVGFPWIARRPGDPVYAAVWNYVPGGRRDCWMLSGFAVVELAGHAGAGFQKEDIHPSLPSWRTQ